MAVPGPNGLEYGSRVAELTVSTDGWPPEKLAIAALYARGLRRSAIIKKFSALGVPDKKVRAWIRKWKRETAFQDLVWDLAMADMRLAEPTVVMAMLRKSQHGDVTAAKFFLELTGRYTPKPESVQASQINLILPADVGRPDRPDETFHTGAAEQIREELVEIE